MAANDLTSLENVKGWLGITSTEYDTTLTRLVTSCSFAMQAFMNRTIAVTAFNERRNGPGLAQFMVMGNWPLQTVDSLLVNGVQIPAAGPEYNSPGFSFDERNIYLGGSYSFARGKGNVQISYTAGYAAVPPDLEQACIETVSMRWREHDRIGMASKGLAGETTAFSLKDFNAQTMTLLNNYKKVVPV